MHDLRDNGIHTTKIGKLHYTSGCDHGAVEEIEPMHVAGDGSTIALVRDGTATFDAAPELARIRRFCDHDSFFDDAGIAKARCSYLGLIAFMDDCMGQVLTALEQSGQADDTLVVYVSDHGEMLGDHGFWGKSVMLEPSVAVPVIVAGPGVPASRCITPVSLLDIATTTHKTVGLGGYDLPGDDLSTLAQQPDDPGRTAFSEHHDGGSTIGPIMVCWDD